jgi:putative transposase
LTKRGRHTPEQVIRKLREAERLLGEGKTIPEAAKELGISEQTYHRWRNQCDGMKADDPKRLKELERENATLGWTNQRGPANLPWQHRETSRVRVGESQQPELGELKLPVPAAVAGYGLASVCKRVTRSVFLSN